MKKMNGKALLALLLTLIFVCSCIIPAGAKRVSVEDVTAEDLTWKIDLGKMTSVTDNLGNPDYKITLAGAPTFKDVGGEKVLSFNHSAFFIDDVNLKLNTLDTFYVDYDVYFEKFPVGERDGLNQDEYPIAIFTWVAGSGSSKNYDRSIRIDGQGNLFRTRYTSSAIGAKIDLKTWVNLRFAISPEDGSFEIYLNGENIYANKYGALKNLNYSAVRFFDTAYDYEAYVKNVSVYSANGFKIKAGFNTEETSDFLGFQTTKTENGKFDLRAVATINKLDYNQAGVQFITLTTAADGTNTEAKTDVTATEVFEKINAGGKTLSASDYESAYFTAFTLGDIDASAKRVEVVARPFMIKNGYRIYGQSANLEYTGGDNGGYPEIRQLGVTEEEEGAEEKITEIICSDDTYARKSLGDQIVGDQKYMELKNNGEGAGNTRVIYLKFTVPDEFGDTILESGRVVVKINLKSGRPAAGDEIAAGGVERVIYATGTDWDEETLHANNANTIAPIKGSVLSSIRTGTSGYISFDVTEYAKEQIENGATELSFAIKNVAADGSSAQTTVYSKEDSAENAPVLAVESGVDAGTSSMHYEFRSAKYDNKGYEPWGFAEKIVKDWIDTEYDAIFGTPAKTDAFKVPDVNMAAKTGAHIISLPNKGGDPVSAKTYNQMYARTIDSLISEDGYVEGAASEYDDYGGIINAGWEGKETGFFHTEEHNGRTYIIDPLGYPFFVFGVNTVNAGTTSHQKEVVTDRWGSDKAFYEYLTNRFHEICLNTVTGAVEQMTSTETPVNGILGIGGIGSYMGGLGLSVSTGGSSAFKYNDTMNVFDPDFVTTIFNKHKATLEKYKDSPYIIGYTSDNEIPKEKDMLNRYLTLDPTVGYNVFSYATAWTWLCEKTGKVNPSLEDVTSDLQVEFIGFVYNRLFKVIRASIDANDPNHMYIGTRADGNNKTNEGYLRTAGYYCDLLTINMYDGLEPNHDTLQTIYKYSGKPFIVTEFYAKAADAVDMNGQLLGNQQNAGCAVQTQKDRANYYENYTMLMLESKYCVGWVWYKFQDNDQSLYSTDNGTTNVLRVFQKGSDYDIVSFLDENGKVVNNNNDIKIYYQGETDTSNLGSNKGIWDNQMEEYPLLVDSITRIGDNIFGLINFFDNRNK